MNKICEEEAKSPTSLSLIEIEVILTERVERMRATMIPSNCISRLSMAVTYLRKVNGFNEVEI